MSRKDRGIQRPPAPQPANDPQGHSIQSYQKLSIHSGPFPAPQELREYDELLPGCAERIISRWEKQSDHRMRLEAAALDHEIRRSNLGLWCATGIVISFLIGGLLVVWMGYPREGVGLAGVTLAGGLSVFFYGVRSKKQERIEKAHIMSGIDRG